MSKIYRNQFILILVISTVLGLGAGIVGQIVSRSYFLGDELGMPLFGQIDVVTTEQGRSVVINDARKVVVEHDLKVSETATKARESLVGIYKKIEPAELNDVFAAGAYYQKEKQLGTGIAVTSDGWIMTSFMPLELKTLLSKYGNADSPAKQKEVAKYVAVSDSGKIYAMQNVVMDKDLEYSFWRLQTDGLKVVKFLSEEEVLAGQSVVAVNQNLTWQTSILGFAYLNQVGLIRSSDSYFKRVLLSDEAAKFENGYVFSLNGDLVGLMGSDGTVSSMENYQSAISSLLKNNEIKQASLGVSYINLSELTSANNDQKYSRGAMVVKNQAGVAVVKGSAAEKAGLQDQDIIISINNVNIDKSKDLNELISQYVGGEVVIIKYVRAGEEKTISVELGVR